jgi:Na+/H+ antiporter NhaD/arsenite permease-like protein
MRARCVGVVFFIFTVSNNGGCLTALGDPPLFLGFLRGVPFAWPISHLVPEWAVALGLVLATYFVLDRRMAKGDPPPPETAGERFGVDGWRNAFILLGVVGVVVGQGLLRWPFGVQEGAMAALALISLKVTPAEVRRANKFTFGPILEVAILFSGIFTTMVPALVILAAKGDDLGLTQPWHYFWATGTLSSFLDNAPTYLTLGTTAAAQVGIVGNQAIGELAVRSPALLAAVSCGAVFMGANTYIGNGPNFMVRAIAVEGGVDMPSFFGYMKYTGMILVPVFVVLTLLFFTG